MFLFSPPLKALRTQTGDDKSATEASPRGSFLSSGMGKRKCWSIDETKRCIKIWDYAWMSRSCSPLEPFLAPLPRSAAFSSSTPLFFSEIGEGTDQLALCSVTGAVCSLDHSLEFQLWDTRDENKRVSSFTATNRTEYGNSVVTAVGTSDGFVVVNVKSNGNHYTAEALLSEGSTASETTVMDHEAATESGWWSSVRSLLRSSATNTNENEKCPVDTAPLACHGVALRDNPLELLALSGGTVHAFSIVLTADGSALLKKKWRSSISAQIARDGVVLQVGESLHRVCVLFTSTPTIQHPTSTLYLVTLDGLTGQVTHYASLNAAQAAVSAAVENPTVIKMFVSDDNPYVVVCVSHFVMSVNISVGPRHPCSKECIATLKGLRGCITSVLLPNGSLISLDAFGPSITKTNVIERGGVVSINLNSEEVNTEKAGLIGPDSAHSNVDATQFVEHVLTTARMDPRLTLDAAFLATSESFYGLDVLDAKNSSALAVDPNEEGENAILHVTTKLRRSQQAHRRFLIAAVTNIKLLSSLCPDTLGQTISAQEALLVLSSLRGLQNVGFLPQYDASSFRSVSTPFRFCAGKQREIVPTSIALIDSHVQLQLCQKILRDCIIEVGGTYREERGVRVPYADVVFSHPLYCMQLLARVHHYCEQTRANIVATREEKFRVAYAGASIFVVAAQTILESRDDLSQHVALSSDVSRFLWTNSKTAPWSIKELFAKMCLLLSDIWRDTASGLATGALQSLLDLFCFLLHFAFVCHTHSEDSTFYSSMLRATLLRDPLVQRPYGYPHGPPRPGQLQALGERMLSFAELISLRFDIFDVLFDFSLAVPVADPVSSLDMYDRYLEYCRDNERFFTFSMAHLLKQQREWELLSLPAIAGSDKPTAYAEREYFLERYAPHLLWVSSPQRFDGLIQEGIAEHSAVQYGANPLAHRSRCTAVARLAYIAAGSPSSAQSAELELSSAIVRAQKKYFPSLYEPLGLQQLVQHLLALPGRVDAWVEAARVALWARESVAEDLLSQILRQCKIFDGDIFIALDSCVSESDVSRVLRHAATGAVIQHCNALQSLTTLKRLGGAIFSAQELTLLGSWVEALWCGRVAAAE